MKLLLAILLLDALMQATYASHCVPKETDPPPTTEPPTTEPPTTEPPTTEPSTTEPPTAEPSTTEPPTTAGPFCEWEGHLYGLNRRNSRNNKCPRLVCSPKGNDQAGWALDIPVPSSCHHCTMIGGTHVWKFGRPFNSYGFCENNIFVLTEELVNDGTAATRGEASYGIYSKLKTCSSPFTQVDADLACPDKTWYKVSQDVVIEIRHEDLSGIYLKDQSDFFQIPTESPTFYPTSTNDLYEVEFDSGRVGVLASKTTFLGQPVIFLVGPQFSIVVSETFIKIFAHASHFGSAFGLCGPSHGNLYKPVDQENLPNGVDGQGVWPKLLRVTEELVAAENLESPLDTCRADTSCTNKEEKDFTTFAEDEFAANNFSLNKQSVRTFIETAVENSCNSHNDKGAWVNENMFYAWLDEASNELTVGNAQV